jgi:D-alanyl-D-alanine carboxypeptidase
MADETTFTYKADFSQIKKEIDETITKVNKLGDSLDRTSKKFGSDSPQARMVKTALDRVSAELDKKIAQLEKLNNQKPGEDSDNNKGGKTGGRNSSERDLENRYKRESLKYYKDFSTAFGRTGKILGSTAIGFAAGGGMDSIARGMSEVGKHFFNMGAKGLASSFGQGAAMANLSKGAAAAGVRKASAGGAAAAEEGTAGAVEEAVSVGAGLGIMKAFAMLPGPAKLLIAGLGAALAVGGVDAKLLSMAASDVSGRSRRARGFGTNIGEMTSFEDTMGRFVDPDNVLKSMQQAKYDITSPAFTAMKIAGLPTQGDTTTLAEANIVRAQTELKAMNAQDPQTLLTMAHARGFAARGFSDDDIIRLAEGDQSEVNHLIKKAARTGPRMDVSDEERKAYDDLITNIKVAGDLFKTWGEDKLAKQIPILEAFGKKLMDIIGIDGKDIFSTSPIGAAAGAGGTAAASVGGGSSGSGAPGGVRRRGSNGAAAGGGGLDGPSVTYSGPPGEGWRNRWGSASGSTQPGSTEGWGLQPGFKEKIDKMLAAGAAAGFPARINEGFRSYEYQAMLYAKLHGHAPVAAPGGSWHEKGFAVDLTTKGLAWYIKHAPEFGIYPGANFNDPGHFQDHEGRASAAPPYVPHWVNKPEKVSMNDMRHFQGNSRPYQIRIDNQAGANYAVAGGMLGASLGNFGNA